MQTELDTLFGALVEHGGRRRAVSAQAFSKARRGLSAELFELARARLISLAQLHIDSTRGHGLRRWWPHLYNARSRSACASTRVTGSASAPLPTVVNPNVW